MDVICLKWGDKFNHEHVNRLYRMVCKNIDCDFNFIRHSVGEKATKIYTNNVTDDTVYEFPSLQRKKRSGRCYFEVNLNRDFFKESNYFLSLDFVG